MPSDRQAVWLPSIVWPKLLAARRLTGRQLIARLAFLLIGLGVAAGIYGASRWFLGLCYAVEAIGPLLCRRLLDLVLLVLLSVLWLSNVITALSSFFLARDLELLGAAPLPPRALFGARFLEQVLHSSWMVLAFGLPVVLAFAGVAGGARTYLAIAAVLPPLLFFPAAAGFVLALLLVSALPAARVRDLVLALCFVGFLVFYLLIRLAEPERLLNPDGFASLVQLLASLSSSSSIYLPSNWATRVLVATFRDTTALDWGWLLALLTLWSGAGAVFVLSSALFRQLYPRAFSRSQEGLGVAHLPRLWAWMRGRALPADGPLRTPGRRAPAFDLMRLVARLLPAGPTREFLIKDTKLLLRDASQWSQLVLLLALVFVYLYNFRHFRQLGDSGLIGRLALFLLGLTLSSFVTTAVSVRFAFPLISLEGRMLWLLRTAPLWPRQLLWSKLVATLPPLVLVALAMSVASSLLLGVKPSLVLLAAGVSVLTATSVCSLAIGLGAVLPDYEAESAAKVAAGLGGLVCMSIAMLVGLGLVGFAIHPAHALHSGGPLRVSRLVVSLGGSLVLAGTAIVLPLWLGARALARQAA